VIQTREEANNRHIYGASFAWVEERWRKSLGFHPSSTGFCHDHLSNPNPNHATVTGRLPMQHDGILQPRSMEYGVKRDFLANGFEDNGV
jgi:hypothetical protein